MPAGAAGGQWPEWDWERERGEGVVAISSSRSSQTDPKFVVEGETRVAAS